MKTGAYKLKEKIARYIYKRLYPYIPSIVILFNSEERRWKLYDKDEWMSLEYVKEIDEVEKALGIDLYFTLNITGTLLWNKEKELKALKRERKKQWEETLRSADECAKAFDDLIGQWIKEGRIKE